MSSTPVRLNSSVRTAVPRGTVRSVRTGSAGPLAQHTRMPTQLSASTGDLDMLNHRASPHPDNEESHEVIDEVEEDIPELITGFPAEVCDEEGEGDSEDDEDHLTSRQLLGLARSAPPGSLRHLNSSYDMSADSHGRMMLQGGHEVFLDSDDGADDFEAYVGEEFEADLDEDVNLSAHPDDYEVSNAYHRHLRFYGGLLGHDIDDADDDVDDCREVSDVDEDDYVPDLLSDQDADEIVDCISDDGRDSIDDRGCSNFISDSEYGELHRAFARSEHVSHDSNPYRSANEGDTLQRPDAHDKDKMVFNTSGSWNTGGWLASGLFCSSALPKKKPSLQVQSVLDDKDWITSVLATLPGVDPQDSSIQAVLASLRGEAAPNSPLAMKSKATSVLAPSVLCDSV